MPPFHAIFLALFFLALALILLAVRSIDLVVDKEMGQFENSQTEEEYTATLAAERERQERAQIARAAAEARANLERFHQARRLEIGEGPHPSSPAAGAPLAYPLRRPIAN